MEQAIELASKESVEFYQIAGYPNYEISKSGVVRNKESGRVLNGSKNEKTGFRSISLKNNNSPKTEYIHVLMYKTFVGELNQNKEDATRDVVYFIDDNKDNLNPSNLGVRSKAEHSRINIKKSMQENGGSLAALPRAEKLRRIKAGGTPQQAYNYREWIRNDPTLLEDVPQEYVDISWTEGCSPFKTWEMHKELFSWILNPKHKLKEISKVFDLDASMISRIRKGDRNFDAFQAYAKYMLANKELWPSEANDETYFSLEKFQKKQKD